MGTNRIEAFSDGVIAVIITVMVLELKVPHDTAVASLMAVLPSFLVYGMSFLVVAIMWVNHHHLLHAAKRADAPLLWANNNLLFWMSVIPFVTAYLGENHAAPLAVAAYGAVMSFTSFGYMLLQMVLAHHNRDGDQRTQHRLHWKATSSMLLYASTVGLAYVSVPLALAIFVVIPAMYFWPE